MVIRLVSRLGLLKAVHSSIEAEVHLAVVLVGQAVEPQGPAEWHLATSSTHTGRRRTDLASLVALLGLDGAGVVPRKRC